MNRWSNNKGMRVLNELLNANYMLNIQNYTNIKIIVMMHWKIVILHGKSTPLLSKE